jgi:phosphoglucosamine mutase
MTRLFGTDGIRSQAGQFPLDAPTTRLIGWSLARHLKARSGARAPFIATGRDTRESGPWLESQLTAGAREAGAEVQSAGVITTPGVAFLTRALPADAGVVISASHNPYQDNGIKIFEPSGRKLDDATEKLIEADVEDSPPRTERILAGERPSVPSVVSSDDSTEAPKSAALRARYLNYLAQDVAPGLRLDKLTMVVDCANGAASDLAPALFRRLGARVTAINNQPNGRNINRDCGSLDIEGLKRKVVDEGADFGVAYDGDADRALFIDAEGKLVDGDAALWVMAKYLQARGQLREDTVVATVMSNIGLEIALRSRDIRLLRTDVGDKYVLEKLLETGASVGGEQSGHIIFPKLSLAGDGMITTLRLLRVMRDEDRRLAGLTKGFERFPQVLINVRVREKRPFQEVPMIARLVEETTEKLGDKGRLLLRYSGTERLARVMIEGPEQKEIEQFAKRLAEAIREALGV